MNLPKMFGNKCDWDRTWRKPRYFNDLFWSLWLLGCKWKRIISCGSKPCSLPPVMIIKVVSSNFKADFVAEQSKLWYAHDTHPLFKYQPFNCLPCCFFYQLAEWFGIVNDQKNKKSHKWLIQPPNPPRSLTCCTQSWGIRERKIMGPSPFLVVCWISGIGPKWFKNQKQFWGNEFSSLLINIVTVSSDKPANRPQRSYVLEKAVKRNVSAPIKWYHDFCQTLEPYPFWTLEILTHHVPSVCLRTVHEWLQAQHCIAFWKQRSQLVNVAVAMLDIHPWGTIACTTGWQILL